MDYYSFAKLPENMKVLIAQLTEGPKAFAKLPVCLPLIHLTLKNLPHRPIGNDPGDERDEAYALAMDLTNTPPLLVAEGYWLDGKHRVWVARKRGVLTLPAIDLTGYISNPAENSLGKIRGYHG